MTPDEKRLIVFSRHGRFGPHAYRDATGTPRACTDGHALIVLGVSGIDEAVTALRDLLPATGDGEHWRPPLPTPSALVGRPRRSRHGRAGLGRVPDRLPYGAHASSRRG